MNNNKKKEICWFNNITNLFDDVEIIPKHSQCLEKKINNLTRLMLLLFVISVILGIFDLKTNLIILLFSSIIIILLYNKQKMTKKENINDDNYEGYTNIRENYSSDCKLFTPRITYNCKLPSNLQVNANDLFIKQNIEANKKFMNHSRHHNKKYNPNFATVTDNQKLVGRANPKTLVAPIIAPPMTSSEWRREGLFPEVLNTEKQKYHNLSGYDIDKDNYIEMKYKVPNSFSCPQKLYKNQKRYAPMGLPKQEPQQQPIPSIKENFDFPYEIKNNKIPHYINNDAELLYNAGYDDNELFKTKLSNDENVLDEIIYYPTKYSKNIRNEPINTLIGITEPEQFEPVDYELIEPDEDINMSNVFDPRFTGYSSNERNYTHNVTGQPRFYYDDIDAIKMPNYITRNALDMTNFGDRYGPMNSSGNDYTSNIHNLANSHYMDSMNQFREDITASRMRKINAESAQKKMYPKYTHSQR